MAKNKYPDWKDYEKQIHKAIEKEFPIAEICFNDSIKGKESNTLRQIDVSIWFTENKKNLLGIVECKQIARKVEIGKIDALFGKLHDVKADFGLIFTTVGFTKGAEKLAEKHNIGIRSVAFEYLKDFQYIPANELDDVFMQEIDYRPIYCKKCRKTNFYEIKIIRGFGDFDEDIICPECKTPHLNTRTDGGYKVIKRFNSKEISDTEYTETIITHLLETRNEWDKKLSFIWDYNKTLPLEKLCSICSKELNQGTPGTFATTHGKYTICFECSMSSRTLLIDYNKINS